MHSVTLKYGQAHSDYNKAEFSYIYHHAKFKQNQFIHVRMHVKEFFAVSKTRVVFLDYNNSTEKETKYQQDELELIRQDIKSHPDPLKTI